MVITKTEQECCLVRNCIEFPAFCQHDVLQRRLPTATSASFARSNISASPLSKPFRSSYEVGWCKVRQKPFLGPGPLCCFDRACQNLPFCPSQLQSGTLHVAQAVMLGRCNGSTVEVRVSPFTLMCIPPGCPDLQTLSSSGLHVMANPCESPCCRRQ